MEFFRKTTCIDFMRLRKHSLVISLLLLVFSVGSIMHNGLRLGLDFTGGIQVELHFPNIVETANIRQSLEANNEPEVQVQSYGTARDILLKFQKINKNQDEFKQSLLKIFPNVEIRRIDIVGPQIGEELLNDGMLAVFLSVIATMAYIAIRFEYRFAISAALSLIHDPVLILGIFAFFKLEFNLISLAALLTILGYSLNDTIVVYDRIREAFKIYPEKKTFDIVNLSINQTLSRTIMTSGLTLMVVLALYIWGGPTLSGFALALIIGILVGTYSSIYIAGGFAVALGLSRETLIKPKKQSLAGTV